MDETEHRNRSCWQKRAYITRKQAKDHLTEARKHGKHTVLTGEHEVYVCRYCKHFHVGRPPKK